MPQYELRSFKRPLLRGHAPIALEPADKQIMADVEVGEYYDASRGKIIEQHPQMVPGEVSPVDESLVIEEAEHLFSNKDCWQLTICEYAKDANGNELRSAPHWCAEVSQVQAYLDEGK